MKKINLPINININRDENEINDFLVAWSAFGSRPNKVVLHGTYDSERFLCAVGDVKDETVFAEHIPAEDSYIVNQKNLATIGEGIYISYVHYDVGESESFVGDVSVYYMSDQSDKVSEIVDALKESEDKSEDSDGESPKVFSVGYSQNGFEMEPAVPLKIDVENSDMYYSDSAIKNFEKMVKSIGKSPKGLSVIYGKRGVGKTGLLSLMCSMTEKNVIFVPGPMIEIVVVNPDFRNFLKNLKNSVVVIDDAEIYLSSMYSKSSVFVNNLLQLVDGFQSDDYGINIVLSLNVGSLDEIDPDLLECNNLHGIVEVGPLSKTKSQELSKHLGLKNYKKESSNLVDVLKKRNVPKISGEIGF